MTAPEAPALQRLADVAALERPAEAKRMLVIVNPYATTMTDRIKDLVVYALQGRYDVEAVDTQRRGHATELCREAAAEELWPGKATFMPNVEAMSVSGRITTLNAVRTRRTSLTRCESTDSFVDSRPSTTSLKFSSMSQTRSDASLTSSK